MTDPYLDWRGVCCWERAGWRGVCCKAHPTFLTWGRRWMRRPHAFSRHWSWREESKAYSESHTPKYTNKYTPRVIKVATTDNLLMSDVILNWQSTKPWHLRSWDTYVCFKYNWIIYIYKQNSFWIISCQLTNQFIISVPNNEIVLTTKIRQLMRAPLYNTLIYPFLLSQNCCLYHQTSIRIVVIVSKSLVCVD